MIKGETNSGSFKKGQKAWNKGKHMSKESRLKLSISKSKNPTRYWLGKERFDMKGKNNNNWKGGISKLKGYDSFIEQQRTFRKRANGGHHNYREWLDLKAKYNNTCLSCYKKEPNIKLSEDHIIPISKGGSNDISNIQPLCVLCNSIKRDSEINYTVAYQTGRYLGHNDLL